MKIDLHCHSKYSERATLWIMQKLGCPESFTEPLELYQIARQRGMTAVTITDHNVIDGALEIAHLPNTFVSCEYTTYFPEDRCKVHVLVHDITEAQHRDLSRARENIFDFVDYAASHRLKYACAHPLFGVNDRLTFEHIEQMVLLFKYWEWNGSIDPLMNAAMCQLVERLTGDDVEQLVDKYGLCPRFPEPWRKIILVGSDDHSSLSLGQAFTEVQNAAELRGFWSGLAEHRATVHCQPASPLKFGRQIYGTAYQFYKSKFGLEQHVNKDFLLHSLDGLLQVRPEAPEPWLSRLHGLFTRRRKSKDASDPNRSVLSILKQEAHELILNDPRLRAIIREGDACQDDVDAKWFEFVNQLCNRVLVHFGNRLLERLVKGHLFDLFHTVGSAGALYALLAPYFLGFSLHVRQRTWSAEALEHFARGHEEVPFTKRSARLAHFTDTYFEVNGVARTLQQSLAVSQRLDRDYRIITCGLERHEATKNLIEFPAVGEYALPEYPELKMIAPSFLEMLNHCYEEEYTHIHVATPGPVGLAGLLIARILQLPVSGTYHTALPEYAKILTEDSYVESLTGRCVTWFYGQLDEVFVPSLATGEQLAASGIARDKVRVYPRGCDIERFHPQRCSGYLKRVHGIDNESPLLLYVGRVSKEKDLPLLTIAFRDLIDKGRRAKLVVVGDGPYAPEMKESLRGYPALFTGTLDGEELAAVYAECDVLVFPSATDTFGNVVLEAQASGLPVIVTDEGGPQENLVPERTGLIVPAHNAEALAEAMDRFIQEPSARSDMGAAARRYAEGRGVNAAFEQLWEMLTEASESGRAAVNAENPLLNALREARALAS